MVLSPFGAGGVSRTSTPLLVCTCQAAAGLANLEQGGYLGHGGLGLGRVFCKTDYIDQDWCCVFICDAADRGSVELI